MKSEIITYQDRESLYKFLIDEFGFKVIEEEFFPEHFGNFFIILAPTNNFFRFFKSFSFSNTINFLVRYSFDRSEIAMEITSKHYNGNDKWYSLYFIKDLIYNPENINRKDGNKGNSSRIKELNAFLQSDFNKINELYTKRNYPNTKRLIDEGLKKTFYLRFPKK